MRVDRDSLGIFSRHTLALGILGFLIMRVPESDAQRNICLVSGIYLI
jgi:hypothetical protein